MNSKNNWNAKGDCSNIDIFSCNLLEVFEKHRNADVDPYYLDRAGRNVFAASQLTSTYISSILNLGGGGRRHLEKSLGSSNTKVYEVDMQGECDLLANLDELPALPFEDSSFDVVCAFDVLEHLENYHLINEEIFRVAKDYVLISLPNSASEVFYAPFRNRPPEESDINCGVFSKFYGLPLTPPEDRHRWWLYFQDIVRYYYYFSKKHKADLEFWTPRLGFKKRIFKAVLGSHLYHTFFCQHVWVKLKKHPV
jgi:hypothetical protein